MSILIPPKEEFFGRPKRVSRIFVILFIISATLNALLALVYGYREYSYQQSERRLGELVTTNLQLAKNYKAERDDLKISVAEKEEQLTQLNTELKNKTKELSTLNTKVESQAAQLAANSEELESLRSRPPLFSFQRQTGRDVTQDETEVREIVTQAYDIIAGIYDSPYLLHQITISFVDTLSINGAAGEINIKNSSQGIEITIKLINFDKDKPTDVNTIVHEMIHGFHGIAALQAPVLEEGITVATTDIVMSKLHEKGIISLPYNYVVITDEQASQLNKNLERPPASNAFYSNPSVATYYQLAGWAWLKLYQEDASVFKKFNQALYSQVQNGAKSTADLARSIIKQAVGSAFGQSIDDFVNNQIVFNPI